MRQLENHEYERLVIGAVMFNNSLFEEASQGLQLDDFSIELHRFLWRVISNLIQRGYSANTVTVLEQGRGELAGIPPLPWHDRVNPGELTAMAWTGAGTISFYTDTLRELGRMRKLDSLARELMKNVHETRDNSRDVMAKVEDKLLHISTGAQEGYQKAAIFAGRALDDIKADMARKGALKGLPTGFPSLDNMTSGFHGGEYTVIAARPSVGKTSFAGTMILENAVYQGHRVGMYSAEMSGQAIIKRMISALGNIHGNKLRNGIISPAEIQDICAAAEKLMGANLFINDTPNINIMALVDDAKRMVRKEGVKIIFIDYIGLLSSDKEDAPVHERVSWISKRLKQLARELNIPIVVLAQLSRDAHDSRPNMSQLRGSGSIEQDADNIGLLWKREDQGPNARHVVLIWEKNRSGPTGDIDLVFKPGYTKYGELERSQGEYSSR